MHLSRIDVQDGQTVAAGQPLGLSGRTGGGMAGPGCTFDPSTDSHVHMAVQRAADRVGEHPIRGSLHGRFYNVPAEPYVPAAYAAGLVARLARLGITPGQAVAAGGGLVALLLGLGLGWWWLRRRA